ncbi:TlpA family protein disulfide reductase [Flavobacterium ajazii]|uniref:TlpA family protein disulfide reductase n=1 Tax=Flavobacterium ajazii TaxID=2692318 RepID=UPI0013D508CF|nr:TlpA disulfide reductase family protein [Flavobacterium ajazii]
MTVFSTDSKGNKFPKESIYAEMACDMTESNADAAAEYLKYGLDDSKANLDKLLIEKNVKEDLIIRAKSTYIKMLTAYINALSNGQNPENGFLLAKEKYEYSKKMKSINNRFETAIEKAYANALLKTKRYSDALPFLETYVLQGSSDPITLSDLKTAYLAKNGQNADFDSYLLKLKTEQKTVLKEEITKIAIKEPAPEFELKDVNGKTVRLSDYKGKVVVLDFWATWCGPCKASFPAMQKTINRYNNDPGVVFLFLHTWEKKSGNPTVEAGKYITDNKYTFKVLMDLRNSVTNESAAASAYKVKGIPAKFVIDGKGDIRFSTSGFSQDADKAVEELSAMIEFAKQR